MPQPVARYSITYGLRGCYMPGSQMGPYEFTTRKELADYIRTELTSFDMPARLFREVNLRRLWGFIKRHGSSQAHFALHHGHNALEFHGLTEEEFNQMSEEE